jgi:hypothetical protein
MKKNQRKSLSGDDKEAPSPRQQHDDNTSEKNGGHKDDSSKKNHQEGQQQQCISSSPKNVVRKKVDYNNGSEKVAAAPHRYEPQDSQDDEVAADTNPTAAGNDIPAGVPGAYRVTPNIRRGSTNDNAAAAAALQHREDGFPGQVFFIPGESLLRPQGESFRRPQRDVAADELDRLGVPTIICDAVVATEVNDDDNNDYHDEENIPCAEVSLAQVAEPLNTSSVCCLHKEVNRCTAKWIVCILSLVLVASIASVATIFNHQRKEDFTKEITTFAGLENMSIVDEDANTKYLQELVSTLSSQEDLQDPSSPQSRAVAWMVGQPDLNFIQVEGFDRDSRVKERYAMAVLYYSTNGENWTRGEPYLTKGPICAWDTSIVECHPMILKEEGEVMDTSRFSMLWGGRVVELNLGKFTLLSPSLSSFAPMIFICQ